jgi:hypothetical protein
MIIVGYEPKTKVPAKRVGFPFCASDYMGALVRNARFHGRIPWF